MINIIKKANFLIFIILTSSIQGYNFIETLNEINKINREAIFQTLKVFFPRTFNNNSENLNYVDLGPCITEDKSIQATKPQFTFKDLAGNIPEDVKEIVDVLKNPERFRKVGAQMPKGILLVGPPGTGKTSIARAIAGEADAEFFSVSASEFIEIYVGTGPKRIRELFEKAHKVVENSNKKAIIFIDELDAIGCGRSNGNFGCSEYRNTLNELLNQMDGFKQFDSILVIGATNTPNSIDLALKRPGRFDRIVEINLPDQESRIQILNLYCKKIRCASDINIVKLAETTKGFSGAELKNLVNEAAVRAARQNMSEVHMEHFELALMDLKVRKKYLR